MKKAKLVAVEPRPEPAAEPSSVGIPVASPRVSLRLDLASGQTPKEGFESVDLDAPAAKHRVDLLKFPWPWADDSVEELHCSHFVEHLPAREVEQDGKRRGQDFFFAFFDECYRILAPDAWMTVVSPAMPSDRAFQDPTHRRFFTEVTWHYLSGVWRFLQRLDHYRAECDFDVEVGFAHDSALSTMHPEAASRRLHELWNQRHDWIVKLKAVKPRRFCVRDIHGVAVFCSGGTTLLRFDDLAPGAPWPHDCVYVFDQGGREHPVKHNWPPMP